MKKRLTSRQIVKYRNKILKVLDEQNFIVGKREKKIIEKKLLDGRRYFFMVAPRKEGKKIVDRFIKIPQNNTKKLLLPFERQIEVAKFLKQKNIINTRGIIKYNHNKKKGIPYAVMETFPINKSRIGFVETSGDIKDFGIKEARSVVTQLNKFHAIPVKSLPSKLRSSLQVKFSDYKGFKRNVMKYINYKVKPLDAKGKKEIFHKVIERRLGIQNFKDKCLKLLNDLEPIINTKQNKIKSMAHGDLSPPNLYVFNSGEVEFLDLEWASLFSNRAISMIYDYGNFRARSWSNKKFRELLDAEMIKSYRKNKQEELGRTIITLSILRSHSLLSRAFENYDLEKQKIPIQTSRRLNTEKDLLMIFDKK